MKPAELRVHLQSPWGSAVHRDQRDQAKHTAGKKSILTLNRQQETIKSVSWCAGVLPGGGVAGGP